MKRKILNFWAIALTLVALGSISNSCIVVRDDPPVFDAPFIGSWYSTYNFDGLIPVNSRDYHEFYFYTNGRGLYRGYDEFGRFFEDPFSWNWYDYVSYGKITFRYDHDGYRTAYFRFYNGYLELCDNSSFNVGYTGYLRR